VFASAVIRLIRVNPAFVLDDDDDDDDDDDEWANVCIHVDCEANSCGASSITETYYTTVKALQQRKPSRNITPVRSIILVCFTVVRNTAYFSNFVFQKDNNVFCILVCCIHSILA